MHRRPIQHLLTRTVGVAAALAGSLAGALAVGTLAAAPAGAAAAPESFGIAGDWVAVHRTSASARSSIVRLDVRHSTTFREVLADGPALGLDFADPQISPDHRRVVYTGKRADGTKDLYLLDRSSGTTTQLTNSPGVDDADPAWSPDGTQLAFASNRSGRYLVWRMPLSAPASAVVVSNLPSSAWTASMPTWDPTDQRVAYVVQDPAGPLLANEQVWASNPDGSGATQLTTDPGWYRYPQYSPEGSMLAFGHRQPEQRYFHAWTATAAGTDLVDVSATFHDRSSTSDFEGDHTNVTWLPRTSSGSALRLAYERPNSFVDGETFRRVWTVDARATGRTTTYWAPGQMYSDLDVDTLSLSGCDRLWYGSTGDAGRRWSVATNWRGGTLPTASSRVCVTDMVDAGPSVDAAGAVAGSIRSREPLTLAGGTLDPGSGITLLDGVTMTLSGGSLLGAGSLRGGVFLWGGTTLGTAAQEDTGTWTVATGSILRTTGGSEKTLWGARTLRVAGTLDLSDGSDLYSRFDDADGPFLAIDSTGVVRNTGAAVFIGTRLTNNGTLTTTGTQTATGNPARTVLSNASTGTGRFSTTAPAQLQLAGTHTLGAPTTALTGTGTVQLTGSLDVGTLGLTAPSAGLDLQSGTLRGSGPLTGTFRWGGTNLGVPGQEDTGTWTVPAGSTLRTLGGSEKTLWGARTLRVAGTLDLSDGSDLYSRFDDADGPFLAIDSTGVVRNTGAAVFIGTRLTNNGTLTTTGTRTDAQTGTTTPASTRLSNVSTGTGRFSTTAPAQLQLAGSHAFGTPTTALTGTGTVRLTGALDVGTLGLTAPSAGLDLESGTLRGSGVLTGTFRWAGTQLGTPDLADSGTWTVATGSTLRSVGGSEKLLWGARTLRVAGTLDLSDGSDLSSRFDDADGPFLVVDPTGVVNNTGGDVSLGTRLTNNGTLTTTGTGARTLVSAPTATSATLGGAWVVGDASTTLLATTVAPTTLSGTVNLSGTGALTRGSVIGGPGILDSVTAIASAGRLLLRNGAVRTQSAALSNAGAVSLSSSSKLSAPSYRQTGGSTTLSSSYARLTASGGISLTGGTVTAVGVLTGAVANTGATALPGSGLGTFRVSGTYAQSGSGVLELDVAGTDPESHDVLRATGGITLGGTVRVRPASGFTAAATDRFAVLDAPSASTTAQVVSTGAQAFRLVADGSGGLVLAPVA